MVVFAMIMFVLFVFLILFPLIGVLSADDKEEHNRNVKNLVVAVIVYVIVFFLGLILAYLVGASQKEDLYGARVLKDTDGSSSVSLAEEIYIEEEPQEEVLNDTRGLQGLRGVNNKNVISEEEAKKYNLQEILTGESYRERIHRINANASPIQHIGFVGINDSKYDKHITSASQLEDLNKTRAELQQ